MIVRILNEGQWELGEAALDRLNALDDAVERAVADADQAALSAALQQLLSEVRAAGDRVPDADIRDSDLILPDADASLDDVVALLGESDEGLIPNA